MALFQPILEETEAQNEIYFLLPGHHHKIEHRLVLSPVMIQHYHQLLVVTQVGSDAPRLFLTARGELYTKVRGV